MSAGRLLRTCPVPHGVLLLFFNGMLLVFTLFAAVMLHLQILQEEAFLPAAFGQAYQDYHARTGRYLGWK